MRVNSVRFIRELTEHPSRIQILATGPRKIPQLPSITHLKIAIGCWDRDWRLWIIDVFERNWICMLVMNQDLNSFWLEIHQKMMWLNVYTVKLQNILQIYAQFVFVVVGGKSIYIYPSRLLHRHWGNRKIAPVPVKQPWKIWVTV